MYYGEYIGPDEALQGETALLLPYERRDMYLVQFDNLARFSLPQDKRDRLCFGWRYFPKKYFKVDKEKEA